MLRKLFNKNKKSIDAFLEEGGIIVDVRSKAEYAGGHLSNSINIPLDTLQENLGRLQKSKPVITCCASGIRSASAKKILKASGFNEVVNGGGWSSLKKYDN